MYCFDCVANHVDPSECYFYNDTYNQYSDQYFEPNFKTKDQIKLETLKELKDYKSRR